MKLSDELQIPAEVVARRVGDETVLLHLPSGTYFSLDAVGARVWELLGAGRTLADACDVMLDEFEVSREQLEADVLKLAEELAAHNLVTLLA